MGDLLQRAEDFAEELSATIWGVVGGHAPATVAEASPVATGDITRVTVHPEDTALVPLTIGGEHALNLDVEYICTLDHRQDFLKVRTARFHVLPVDSGDPLFRYEFVDNMNPTLPCAHLHVHAHRDEIVYQLFRANKGKPKTRAKAVLGESARAMPWLSNLHFPLGGPRMRPALEDVLGMLKEEFEVEYVPGYQQVLDDGRARWRRRQVAASVRDAPAEAVRVLEKMGYAVTSPDDGPAAERTARLTCM